MIDLGMTVCLMTDIGDLKGGDDPGELLLNEEYVIKQIDSYHDEKILLHFEDTPGRYAHHFFGVRSVIENMQDKMITPKKEEV